MVLGTKSRVRGKESDGLKERQAEDGAKFRDEEGKNLQHAVQR